MHMQDFTAIGWNWGSRHYYSWLLSGAGTDVGVPLVLLPGHAGSTTMWEPNIPAWSAERYRADRPR